MLRRRYDGIRAMRFFCARMRNDTYSAVRFTSLSSVSGTPRPSVRNGSCPARISLDAPFMRRRKDALSLSSKNGPFDAAATPIVAIGFVTLATTN